MFNWIKLYVLKIKIRIKNSIQMWILRVNI